MNKQLLRLVRLLATTLALSLVSVSAYADELIFIENSFDTSVDHAELIPADQKGHVSWTTETNTLTLRDVQISTTATVLTGWMTKETVIRVEGQNRIYCSNLSYAFALRSAIRFTGPGTLFITTTGNAAITCDGGGVTIDGGVTIVAAGNVGGLYGDFQSPLTIDNAYVCAYTLPNSTIPTASLGYFSQINLKNCEIVSPSGAKIQEINGGQSVTTDGKMESVERIIISPKKGTAKVTLATDPHGKLIAPKGIDLTKVTIGTPITFTAEPSEGYALTKLMAGSEDITNTLTLVVKEDVTVTPTFTSGKVHKVTLLQPEHGTLTIRETEYNLNEVPEGTILHFICTPDKGYEFESLKAGEEDITADLYITVTKDVEIKATYKLIPVKTYKVVITVLGYGTVTADCPDLEAVPNGTTVKLTCTPKTEDDKLVGLTVNGEDIMETKSFVIEDGDARVGAQFKRDIHPAIDAPSAASPYTVEVSEDMLSISGVAEGTPIFISSPLGETLLQTTATRINISDLPQGIYILSVGSVSYKLYL